MPAFARSWLTRHSVASRTRLRLSDAGARFASAQPAIAAGGLGAGRRLAGAVAAVESEPAVPWDSRRALALAFALARALALARLRLALALAFADRPCFADAATAPPVTTSAVAALGIPTSSAA